MEPDEVKTYVGNAKALRNEKVSLHNVFRSSQGSLFGNLYFFAEFGFRPNITRNILEGKQYEKRQILCKEISTMRHHDGSRNGFKHFPDNNSTLGRLNNCGKYASNYDDIHAFGL